MKALLKTVFILNLLGATALRAETWTTVHAGFWNSPSVWSTGVVPPHSGNDTFNLRHCIAIDQNLSFNTGGRLLIDSTGGICGHYTVTINANVNFDKYGILEIDTLVIQSGHVDFYPPGAAILTWYGIITGAGAYLDVHGDSMAVGPWFECVQPEFFFIGIDELNHDTGFNLFPNPNTGEFTVTINEHLQP